ncbi:MULTISPECIES: hypothetical protein [unclassified Mameliella]|uniref:hypothetical protein n=1 Tax=unclassified Mameliella TaxID=2630630 RepID=UPI00273DE508|nr:MULTISPECIES: hypothetical protein [unclassified Mameliella]
MSDPKRDAERYFRAAKLVLDGRDPIKDRGEIMVTLEGTVAAVLIMVMGGDHRKAAAMLNEGLTPGVEGRIAWGAKNAGRHTNG